LALLQITTFVLHALISLLLSRARVTSKES
jgi:hypothetical protein